MKRTLLTCAGIFTGLLLSLAINAKEHHLPGAPLQKAITGNVAALSFIENKGQIVDQYGKHRKDIDYKLDADGMVMFVGDGQLHYQWSRSSRQAYPASPQGGSDGINRNNSNHNNITSPFWGGQEGATEFYRMDVKLVGANKNAVVVAEDEQQYKEMYYVPYRKDALVAHSYTRITYKNVYPNIDWVVYVSSPHPSSPQGGSDMSGHANTSSPLGGGQEGASLKYDFIVHPGGDAADIKIQYNGATDLQLKNGNLVANTPYGSITENAPYSYYDGTEGQEVSSSFKLAGNILSYNIPKSHPATGGANPQSSLIIDPQLLWGTYYGGGDRTQGGRVALDAAGCVYMAGLTNSTSDIATSGAYQTSYAGGTVLGSQGDGFLVKFTPEGKRVWATYYGGSDGDNFFSVAISGTDVYIGGTAGSSGLATAGSHQTTYNNGDAMLVKFDTAGSRVWATYYGGTASDGGSDVVCDGSGNVYLSGSTSSSNDIATSGSYQPAHAGGVTDMFLVKFSSAGVRQWGTYFGGTANDNNGFASLACDASGNVYFAADIKSTGLGTTGTFQPAYSGSLQGDAILAKFTSSGALSWATYYGEAGLQTIHPFITADASGNVYMTGYHSPPLTGSTTYFATTGCYQSTYGGGFLDGFIVKFNNTGGRVWGTFYGGTGDERLFGVTLSPLTGNLYISGRSDVTGLATPEAYQTSLNGSYDAMVLVFTPGGSRVHVTYYGGNGSDNGGFLVPDNYGRVYMVGSTTSTAGIATTGAFQTSNNATGTNNTNAYLASFVPDTAVFIKWPYVDTVICAGDSLIVKDTVFYGFRTGNTFTVQLSDATGSFASPVNIGSVTSRVTGNIRCRIPITTPGGTGYRIRIRASNIPFTSADDYYNIRIKANVQGYGLTTNTPVCEGDTIRLNGATTSTGVTWQWNGQPSYSSTSQNNKIGNAVANMAGDYKLRATLTATGCSVVDSQDVRVKTLPDKPIAGSNTPVCFGAGINFTATSTTPAVSWSWTGPNSYSSTTQNPTRAGVGPADAGDYIVSAILNGCSTKDTETVVVYPAVPAPTAGSNSPVCVGGNIDLTATNVTGATYAWTGPSYTSTTQNPTISGAQLPNSGTYSVIATLNGCQSAAGSTAVTVVQGPTVLIYPSPRDTICNGKSIVLNSLITGAGTGATYQWVKNGVNIPTGTGITYTDNTVINNDTYNFILTPGAGAACATPVSSNSIPITVLQYQTPFVTMTASDTNAWPGLLINFEATAGNAGSFPKYQWKLNGKNVVGATSSIWGAATLQNDDEVCIEITSSYLCSNPATATACKKVKVATGIHKTSNSHLRIYPNPASTQVTIEGLSTGTKIQLNDVYGRMVYSTVATQSVVTIHTQSLVPGNYILQVTDGNGARSSYKLVKE